MPIKKGLPTLRDIAEEAGVTPSTVSAVLNNAPKSSRYTEATKARIRETAQRLGYSSNMLAQALRGQPVNLIGFVSFNVDSTYYGHILNAIESAAAEHEHQVVTANMRRDRGRLEPCIQMMLRWRVRGILLGTIGNVMGGPLRRVLDGLEVPLVNLGSPEPGTQLPCINFDNRETGVVLARHLLELGHRNAIFLTGPTSLAYFGDRCAGFTSTFRDAGATAEVISLAPPANMECAYEATLELVRGRRSFTALVGANDGMAIAAIRALQQSGISVPGQVSVAGVDDVPLGGGESLGNRLGAFLNPALTTVRAPMTELARDSVSQLLKMIGSPVGSQGCQAAQHYVLPPLLVQRESTARPART